MLSCCCVCFTAIQFCLPLGQCNASQVEERERIIESIKRTFPKINNEADIKKAADEFADKIQEYLKGHDTEFSCEGL